MPALSPKKDFYVVVGITLMVLIPAVISLMTIHQPNNIVQVSPDPSPLGYTWSLGFFIFPILVIYAWLHRKKESQLQKKAFFYTISLLIPAGYLLDFFFGSLFFNFPNQAANLGFLVPGLEWKTLQFVPLLPVEEFVFYTTGFICILLLYIWCDEHWFGAYNVPDYVHETKSVGKIIDLHWETVWVGVILLTGAWLWKLYGTHSAPQGWPAYFTFLLVAAIIPGLVFFKTAQPFINWRAFSFTFMVTTLISLIWEATLATPYGWWTYNPDYMMGLFVGAWNHLPVEAVILWMAVTYTTVIIFETFKIYLAMERKGISAWTGKKEN